MPHHRRPGTPLISSDVQASYVFPSYLKGNTHSIKPNVDKPLHLTVVGALEGIYDGRADGKRIVGASEGTKEGASVRKQLSVQYPQLTLRPSSSGRSTKLPKESVAFTMPHHCRPGTPLIFFDVQALYVSPLYLKGKIHSFKPEVERPVQFAKVGALDGILDGK